MYQQFNTPTGTPLTWSQTWIKALTQPSEEAYTEIVNDPTASSGKAFTWVFITAIIGALISGILRLALFSSSYSPTFSEYGDSNFASASMGLTAGSLLCSVPLTGVFSIVFLIIVVGISNIVAKVLGGTGTFDKLVYGVAAYSAPMSLISGIIGSIPFIGCLVFPLALYGIVLNIVAVKAVHQFGWGKAIASSVVIWILLLLFVAVVIIVILALLGPAMGNIFSNIVQNL